MDKAKEKAVVDMKDPQWFETPKQIGGIWTTGWEKLSDFIASKVQEGFMEFDLIGKLEHIFDTQASFQIALPCPCGACTGDPAIRSYLGHKPGQQSQQVCFATSVMSFWFTEAKTRMGAAPAGRDWAVIRTEIEGGLHIRLLARKRPPGRMDTEILAEWAFDQEPNYIVGVRAVKGCNFEDPANIDPIKYMVHVNHAGAASTNRNYFERSGGWVQAELKDGVFFRDGKRLDAVNNEIAARKIMEKLHANLTK